MKGSGVRESEQCRWRSLPLLSLGASRNHTDTNTNKPFLLKQVNKSFIIINIVIIIGFSLVDSQRSSI